MTVSTESTTNVIDLELEEVRQQDGGVLYPAAVVAYASDPTKALHSRFTWDDTKAAHEYRLWQAREIIRVRVKMVTQSRTPVRVYVSLQRDREEAGGGYRTLVDVLSDVELTEELLTEAKRDADRFRQKYRTLQKLAPIIAAMEDIFQ